MVLEIPSFVSKYILCIFGSHHIFDGYLQRKPLPWLPIVCPRTLWSLGSHQTFSLLKFNFFVFGHLGVTLQLSIGITNFVYGGMLVNPQSTYFVYGGMLAKKRKGSLLLSMYLKNKLS